LADDGDSDPADDIDPSLAIHEIRDYAIHNEYIPHAPPPPQAAPALQAPPLLDVLDFT
jgi:hypothetical protein